MMNQRAQSRKLSSGSQGRETGMRFLVASKNMSSIVLAAVMTLPAVAYGQGRAAEAMPVVQQNALVQKYCAVCHDDIHRNGGLSLQHFDASNVDPSLAAMMKSKLKTGAIGAGGLQIPAQATHAAFVEALGCRLVGWHA